MTALKLNADGSTCSILQNQPERLPYVLRRDFQAQRPNKKWVVDMTGVWTQQGWLYVAGIVDCSSRLRVGWAMSPQRDEALVELALRRRSVAASRRQVSSITATGGVNTPVLPTARSCLHSPWEVLLALVGATRRAAMTRRARSVSLSASRLKVVSDQRWGKPITRPAVPTERL